MAGSNQAAPSISGKAAVLPLRGGHTISFKGVTVDRVGVDVGIDGPGVDDLAALLFDRR